MELLFNILLVVVPTGSIVALVAYIDEATDYCLRKGWM